MLGMLNPEPKRTQINVDASEYTVIVSSCFTEIPLI